MNEELSDSEVSLLLYNYKEYRNGYNFHDYDSLNKNLYLMEKKGIFVFDMDTYIMSFTEYGLELAEIFEKIELL